jgi:hypothetical protein
MLIGARPVAWRIPVAAGSRIVNIVSVDTPSGEEPQVVEFGKPWMAKSLDAAIRLTGHP